MKIESRFDHAVVQAGQPCVVHVLLTLSAPASASDNPRPGLNIAAVIDRSGSMSGEPLEYAKQSVSLLLDQLGPEDRFSLVVYGSDVLPLVEGLRTSDKTHIKSIVENIECSGMTNMSGGWLKGIELVSRDSDSEDVRAVLLLTDGQANEGITDPGKLTALGKDVNDQQSIRTTCMGLGRSFNEDLLDGISSAAGGRFYYIETPEHAPEVFKEELGGLLEVVAQNVEIDLTIADGISDVAQLTGYPWKADGANCKLIVGDFSSEQVKHVLFAVELPALTDLSDTLIASMRMSYAAVGKESVQIKSSKQDLVIGVGDSEDSSPPDPEVLMHIGIQEAAEARKQAVVNIDDGDVESATRVLEAKRDKLRAMAPSAANPDSLVREADELDRRATELRESQDIMENRKFMVAESASLSKADYMNTQSARRRRGKGQGSA